MQIKEDPKNYRKHSDRNLELIDKSLAECGAGRSIVTDASGVVIGGNGTLRVANKRGIKQRVIHTNGDELVVVVRDDIAPDDPRRNELALADNASTDSSEFDIDALAADFDADELADWDIDIGAGAKDDDAECGFPELADGEKSIFETVSFVLSAEQARQIREKIADLHKTDEFKNFRDPDGNENRNGNAIFYFGLRQWEFVNKSSSNR